MGVCAVLILCVFFLQSYSHLPKADIFSLALTIHVSVSCVKSYVKEYVLLYLLSDSLFLQYLDIVHI